MNDTTKIWEEIGFGGESYITTRRSEHLCCTVYRHKTRIRFRAELVVKGKNCDESSPLSSLPGPITESLREYRADSLDELLRIAIKSERDIFDEPSHHRAQRDLSASPLGERHLWTYGSATSAIRNAIAMAEDTIDLAEMEAPI